MNITTSDLRNINDLNAFLLALTNTAEKYRTRLITLREKGIAPTDDELAADLSHRLMMGLDIVKEADQKMWGELDGTR